MMKSQETSEIPPTLHNQVPDMDSIFNKLDDAYKSDFDGDLDDGLEIEQEPFQDVKFTQAYTMRLYTHNARNAWNGRPEGVGKKQLPGVEWFVRRTGSLCKIIVLQDDPYAIMNAQEIEKAIAKINMKLNQSLEKIESVITDCEKDGLIYTRKPDKRMEPETFGVDIHNGYSMAAVRLVGRYDKVVQQMHQLRNAALIDAQTYHSAVSMADFRAMTHKLFIALKGISGTTRDDFRHPTGSASHAVEKFGPLPEHILDPDFNLELVDITQYKQDSTQQ